MAANAATAYSEQQQIPFLSQDANSVAVAKTGGQIAAAASLPGDVNKGGTEGAIAAAKDVAKSLGEKDVADGWSAFENINQMFSGFNDLMEGNQEVTQIQNNVQAANGSLQAAQECPQCRGGDAKQQCSRPVLAKLRPLNCLGVGGSVIGPQVSSQALLRLSLKVGEVKKDSTPPEGVSKFKWRTIEKQGDFACSDFQMQLVGHQILE